jgi:hypothetical protein
MSLQRYALSLMFYASCTDDFHPQTLPSTIQLKRLLICDHDVPCSRGLCRVGLSWCDLNLTVFSLAARVFAFSTTLVTSELEVINRLLSFVQEQS